MHHCIFKQNQAHGGYQIVVGILCLLQQLGQTTPALDWHVLGFAYSGSKVAEDVRLFKHNGLVDFLKRLFYNVRLDLCERINVLLVRQLIAVDTLALVQPYTNQISGAAQAFICTK